MEHDDFIQSYFSYIGDTEAPITFHRWSCLSILGAWIGRDYRFRHGHFNIKPNLYTMLMGSAGSRKSTAIKIAARLLRSAGYTKVAAERSTKEKFLLDLAGVVFDPVGADKEVIDSDKILELNLFGESEPHISETLIAADEFNTFIGNGNIEFLSMLGVLWDYEGVFENKVKNSKSVKIDNPFVSILSGNTPTGFSLAFPAEAIGQGIFSRLILIHGEATGKRITFPVAPTESATTEMVDRLVAIKQVVSGDAKLTHDAETLLDKIYQTETAVIPDIRFDSYMQRRFNQLIKLCLILSGSNMRTVITDIDVVYANTILTHAEHSMPKALGEFGKGKNSDVSHKLIQILESSYEPISLKSLWKQLHNDLEDINKLKDILGNLLIAEKIISGGGGFLARRKILAEKSSSTTDFTLLSTEERQIVS